MFVTYNTQKKKSFFHTSCEQNPNSTVHMNSNHSQKFFGANYNYMYMVGHLAANF